MMETSAMSIVRRCLRPGSAWLTALLLFMAMVCASMGVAHAAETITYYYTSPQGTVLAKADASGNIISSADYRPYGTQALGTPEQGPGYTGHVNDVDSGFVYMQARYYDTSVGRFLSADPAASRPADTFSFNRFVYANDNPAINIDPDGKDCTTSNGMTRCVTQSYDVAFRAQPGFVDFKSTSENYHFYSVPLIALGVSVSSARAQLVEFPTPGFSKGASASGTRNDATPVLGGLLSRYISPVMSFTVTNMVDHQPAVVNVTQEGHPLASGIVVREAVPLASGSSLVNTWGEGTSTLQAPGSLTGPIINSIWEEEGPKDYKIPFSD